MSEQQLVAREQQETGSTSIVSASDPSSSSDEVASILRLSTKAAQTGKLASARALLRMVARHYPKDVRVWQHLAALGETPTEQEAAREQIELLGVGTAEESNAVAHPAASPVSSSRKDEHKHMFLFPPPVFRVAHRSHQWLYIAGSIFVVLLILGSISIVINHNQQISGTMPFKPAISQSPTDSQIGEAGYTRERLVVPTLQLPPTATPTSTPVPRPMLLALGTPLEYADWRAVLLRSDYARVLNEAIGSVPAKGQFALAVLSVGNMNTTPRRIPPDLFALVDNQGRLYHPAEGASSAYLSTYGRGQHGDLALEDTIPAGGGMFSVPVLFDVPSDVTELTLAMGKPPATGWPIFTLPGQPSESQSVPTPEAGP